MRPAAVAACVALLVGCEAPPQPGPSRLGGAVARAGDTTLPSALVSDVAQARGQSAHVALDDLLSDVLAAEAARALKLDGDPRVAWAVSAALARRIALSSVSDAAAQGQARPDELESVRVVHAVVRRSARVPEAAALAIAEALRRAVTGATSADDFEARANATPHADARVTVERLPPFSADGQSAEGGFDPSFVAAAFELRRPGQLSPVVATRFGWHVIYLMERSAPADAARRAQELGAAVVELRARQQITSLLDARKKASRVEVLAAADPLMAEVKVP